MRRLLLTGLALSVAIQLPAQAPSTTTQDLATGIHQVNEGDLDAATMTLDSVVQRLKQEKGREKDLATAHLYLAMAHLALSQWERAKGEMREAWRNDRQLALDPQKFPPRVIQLYEETKREQRQAETATAKPAAAQAVPAQKSRSRALPILIGGGLAAGAAVGIAAAAGGGSSSTLPASVSASASPGGTAIVGVTQVTLTATAANLTTPTYSWSFGDGGSTAGQTVTHVYSAAGSFTATVTATGKEGSATGSVAVSTRGVAGVWAAEIIPNWTATLEIAQTGASVSGTWRTNQISPATEWNETLSGTLTSPRAFTVHQGGYCQTEFAGTFDTELMQMHGTMGSAMTDCGAPSTQTLVRH
jgi:chitodextrinase